MVNAPACVFSRDEARSLTDEVKNDAERLWRKLVELYDGGAHLALGYTSWGAYFKAEFGGSERHGYRLLDAGRTLEVLASDQLVTTPNESQARELAPLMEEPELMKEAWEEVIETTNGVPTASEVKAAVKRRTVSEEERQQILSLRRKGMRVADIAESTGWSPQLISKITSVPKKNGLPRRHVPGSAQTRALSKINQTCREWEEIGDEEYIPAPELARRIRVLDGALAFLTKKRDAYKEVAPNGSRGNTRV